MAFRTALLVCVLGLGLTGSVSAQGFATRISPEGIDALSLAIEERLPEIIALPQFDKELFECSGDNIVAHIPRTGVGLIWRNFELNAVNDGIAIDALVDVAAMNTTVIDHAYGCGNADAECDLKADADRLAVHIELRANSMERGSVSLEGVDVSIDLDKDDLLLTSEGCLVGDVGEWLIEAFEGWVLGRVLPLVENLVAEKVAEAVGSVLDDTVGLSIDTFGFSLRGWAQDIRLSPSQGLTLEGDADVMWTEGALYDGDPPATQEANGPPLPDSFGPGEFKLAVSDRLVTEALFEAWRGGLIDGLTGGLVPTIELGGDGIIQQLGLQAGTTIMAAIEMPEPLSASFGREEASVAFIDIPALLVRLEVTPPSGETSRIDVRVKGTAEAGITVSSSLGGLVLELKDLTIERLDVEGGASDLQIGKARIGAFVQQRVVPLLAERFAGIPVAPALQPVAGSFAWVRALDSRDGWQRVGIDLVRANPGDDVAPNTEIEDAPTLVPAGSLVFRVSGSDQGIGATPDELLRYRVWLDDELLTEAPSSARAIRVEVADGDHELKVAAVDLNGNEDDTPASHSFSADGVPPELDVTSAPGVVSEETTLSAAWTASDDRGVVFTSWELREFDGDETVLVDSAEFQEGLSTATLANLKSDAIYELSIIARDEAGNVSSQEFGTVIQPGGSGCAATGGRSSDAIVWLFFLGCTVLVGRRRSSK